MDKNRKHKRPGHRKECRERPERPLTDKPFAAFFKRTKQGRDWMRENFSREDKNG